MGYNLGINFREDVMGSMSIWHWLIVLLVVALIFGTRKLRGIGGDLGGAVKSFKEGMRTGDEPVGQTDRGGLITGGELGDKARSNA